MSFDIFGLDGLCIKVYDPSKKQLIATYKTYTEASKRLGLTAKTIRSAVQSKTRRHCSRLNMEIALRLSPCESVVKENDVTVKPND